MIKLKSKIFVFSVALILIFTSISPVITVNAAIDLSASAISDTQVKLQWSWIMGAVRCRIYRDGSMSPIKIIDINTDSEYTSFTNSGLTPETLYTYRVDMEDEKGNVIESGQVSVKTLGISRPVIISAVFDLAVNEGGKHNITIKWRNSASTVSGATINRLDGTEVAKISKISDYISGDIVTYTFQDVFFSYNQPVQYTVTLIDSQGRKSQPSTPIAVTPLKPPAIKAVIQDGEAVISWSGDIAIENFQLERSRHLDTAWGPWEIIYALIPAGTTSFTDPLAAAGSYRYRLSAAAGSKYIGAGNISDPVQKLVAPSNLVCTYAGDDRVILTWTNDSSNKGVIKIEKRTGQGSFIEIATLARNVSTYTDIDTFYAGQTYYYRVIAYDTDENKAESSIASITLSEPKAPSGLTVTVESNRSLVLDWEDNSNNETSFIIERKTGSGSYSIIGTTGANVNRYYDANLSPDETYTYRVYASNSFGNSKGYSNEVTARPMSFTAPESLVLTVLSISEIDILWTSYNREAIKTIIECKEDKDWKVIAEVPADVKTYRHSGLKENTLYAYRIRSLLGDHVYSPYYPGENKSYAVYTRLGTPEGLTAEVTEEPGIRLTWNDKSSETNFIIQRKEGDGVYMVVASLPANVNTWTDRNVTAGKTYTYRVQARTDKNESDFSEVITINATRIPAPSDLTVYENSKMDIEMTWRDNSDNESGFEIWRKTGIDGVWEKIGVTKANTTSYVDNTAKAGITYYYKVRAYISGSSAVSGFSNEDMKSRMVLEAPEDFSAEALSHSQIRLTWTDMYPEGAEFSIERKKEGGAYKEIAHNITSAGKYIDENLEPNTKYYYRIRAFKRDLYSGYSQEVSATTLVKVEFSDLGSVTWAKDAIENMASRGILKGTGGGKFSPLSTITRAQFVCILIRAYDLADYTSSTGFSDVDFDDWYYKELMAAKALNIISPDSSNKFYPEDPITREDMAVFINKTLTVAGKPLERADASILDIFSDRGLISDYALQSVADLYKAEIMVGVGGGRLDPKGTANRAQAALIISRIIDK